MTSHSNFIFQERREVWDDVLKIVNAERNGAYDLRRIEILENRVLLDPVTLTPISSLNHPLGRKIMSKKSIPFVEERVFTWIFPDRQSLKVKEISPDKQALQFKEVLDTLYRPHELLVYTVSYGNRIFDRTDIQVTKDHPVFTKLNKYLKHIKGVLRLKDEHGNCLNPVNKSLLESSFTFLKTYQKNLIKASNRKENDKIDYLLSPKVLLISETGDVYQISIETAFKLLSVKDIFRTSSRKDDQTGLSPVHSEGNVHFKSISNSKSEPRPGIEFISYALSKTLSKEPLITPSILMKLVDVPQVSNLPSDAVLAQLEGKSIDKALAELECDVEVELVNCFIQASRSVGKQDFQKYLESIESIEGKTDVIDGTSDIMDTFDKMNLSWHFILSLLLQPGDGKSDNYAIEVKDNKNIIIGIDNDKVFYPNIFVSKDTHYVSIQCIFYAWKGFMELHIDEKVRDKVLKTSPSTFLLNWTSILELQNIVYENLMDKGYLTPNEATELQLPLMFTKDIVFKVFHRWEKLQTTLSSRAISHNGILNRIDTFIGSWYKAIREQYSSIMEAGYISYKGFDGNGKRIYLKDVLEAELREQLKEIENTSRVPIQSIYMQQFYESVMQIFKEKHYIENVWHQLEYIHVHDDIYNRLYTYNPNAVDLIDSKGKYPLDYALEAYIDRNHDKPFIRLVSLNAKQMTSNYMSMHFKMEAMIDKDPLFKNSEIYASYLTWIHRYGGKGLWEITLTQMFPEYKREGSYISGSHCGKRYLRKEIEDQLKHDNNNVKYGRRKVKQVHYKGFKVHIKYHPGIPGYEEAVGILCREIIGWGTPYGELFKLEDGTPVWISLSIDGKVLQDVMDSKEYNNTYESQLDNKYMSDIILMSMLMNPEDGKPDNFIVEHINNTCRLVCVDNDQCFVPAYVQRRPKLDSEDQMKPVCQVKTILYCLPHMNEPVHDETKQTFISLHIEALLTNWLNQLNEVNKSYVKLFNNDEVKQLVNEMDPCFTRVGFQGMYIKHIYTKLHRLQNWLRKKNATITHIELLKNLEPFLSSRYKKALNDASLSAWKRFEKVDRCFYGNKVQSIVPSLLILESSLKLPIGKTLLECIYDEEDLGPEEALRVLNEIIKQEEDENLTFEQIVSDARLEVFLKNFDFNDYDYKEKLNLIKQLKKRKLKNMTIRNCDALNDDLFLSFKLKNLLVVRWIDVDVTIVSLKHLASKAKFLETLYLYKCNKLKCLSVPVPFGVDKMIRFKSLKTLKICQCSNIEHVQIHGPNISSLEMKDCDHLTHFKLKAPKLQLIHIQGSERLENLILCKAPLSSHELYKLSNSISHADIQFIKCSGSLHDNFGNVIKKMYGFTYHNYIRVLDNDPTMTKFDCFQLEHDIGQHIQGNRHLLDLTLAYCNLNNLSVETISKMNNLTGLNLSFNNFGDEGCKYLSNLTTLTTLELSNNNIGDEGCKYLSNMTSLITLYMSFNNIGDTGCQYLSNITTLTTLYLSNNNIGDSGCESLSKITHLRILRLTCNKIRKLGCKCLSIITTLKILDLSQNHIGVSGCKYLSNITTLTTLDLSLNKIGDSGCKYLFNLTALIKLELRNNNIGDSGCKYLSNLTTLTTLDLSFNSIGDEGCNYLFDITTLIKIELRNNRIGDSGCKYLSNITTLARLDLRNNNIGDEGFKHLLQSTSLRELIVTVNHIGDEGYKGLTKNTALSTLKLWNTHIGPKGCQYLSKNKTLTTLYLYNTNIGDSGCEYLSKNTTITTLKLWDTHIGPKGCEYLLKNTTLRTLKLPDSNNGCLQIDTIEPIDFLMPDIKFGENLPPEVFNFNPRHDKSLISMES